MCWRKGKCSILGRFLLSEKTQASPKTSTFLQALREQKEQSAPQVKARKDGDCRTSRQPHGTWARPVQQSSNNHKSSPRSVQETQPDFLKLRADLLTIQLSHRARLSLYTTPRPRNRVGVCGGVPGEAAQGNCSPSGQLELESSSLWALGNT